MRFVDWLLAADYTNCCLYIVDSPDDERQACSKHVEAYLNKSIENSTSCWFMLYGYIKSTFFFAPSAQLY
jgi:hypothetical protein